MILEALREKGRCIGISCFGPMITISNYAISECGEDVVGLTTLIAMVCDPFTRSELR